VALLSSISLFGSVPEVQIRDAKVYELGHRDGPVLFYQRIELSKTPEGKQKRVTTISDLQHKVAVLEVGEYSGDQLIRQHVKNFQTGESYEVLVSADKVTFQAYVLKGLDEKPKGPPKTMEHEPTFITGPVFEPFLANHLEELQSGETVKVRLGVSEIQDTVGFKFWKPDKEQPLSGSSILIRMKPTSFIIALAIDPFDLYFDPKTKRITRYVGRTPLVAIKNGKQVPFFGDLVYD
jgi:hypothetical protein